MKILTALLFVTAALSLHAAEVTYVGHDKVATALAKGGPLVTAPDLTVSGSHRDKAGQVEVHDKETDVIHGRNHGGRKVDQSRSAYRLGHHRWTDSPSDQGRRDRGSGGNAALVQRSSPLRQLLRCEGTEAVAVGPGHVTMET